jgi:uncharacterized protein YdcH (DUF465 family)
MTRSGLLLSLFFASAPPLAAAAEGITSDAHFAKLADEYHELNRQIHRIETDVEPASDEHQTELRKQRMALKDELYNMLKA